MDGRFRRSSVSARSVMRHGVPRATHDEGVQTNTVCQTAGRRSGGGIGQTLRACGQSPVPPWVAQLRALLAGAFTVDLGKRRIRRPPDPVSATNVSLLIYAKAVEDVAPDERVGDRRSARARRCRRRPSLRCRSHLVSATTEPRGDPHFSPVASRRTRRLHAGCTSPIRRALIAAGSGTHGWLHSAPPPP
jgi:hypothetical protein